MSYIIPFNNEVVISQGYNGPWSHKKIGMSADCSYSLDFVLPFGTEVIASRSGIVGYIADEYDEFYEDHDFEKGSKCIGNFIDIFHEDKTIANYHHIELGSVSALNLKEGDKVEQGQVIGKTGLSGWVGLIPHLHFMVYKRIPKKLSRMTIKVSQSIPVEFDNYQGPLEHSQLENIL